MTRKFEDLIDSDLLLVSNRQPYRHAFEGEEVVVDQPGGGLVASLDAVAQDFGSTWVAWGDGEADRHVSDETGQVAVPPDDPSYTLDRVWLDEDDVAGYYEGYANRVLWPLCHTATGNVVNEPGYWGTYRDVNEQFAREIVERAGQDSVVWFQDYHFALAPQFVREHHDGPLAHFWHIPWPSPDVFRICPDREAILRGLLANDQLGFHIDQYCEQFLACVETFIPDASVDAEAGIVNVDNRQVTVEAFPVGVDVEHIRDRVVGSSAMERRLRREHPIKGQLVLSVDRLDYSKGIPERLAALEHLWSKYPSIRESFTYVQKGMVSREAIPEYRELHDEIDKRVAAINGRFSTDQWKPIVRIQEFLPDAELYGLYRSADVMLVSPLRDGMNLVAQEYVAAQLERDGVLVLSEFAGGHEFLGEDAISVSPFDPVGLADGIRTAVRMNALERNRRMRSLIHSVEELDVHKWIHMVLSSIGQLPSDSTTQPRWTNK